MTEKEFCEAWREDLLIEAHDDIDDSWRHGNYHNTVFQHRETAEFWSVGYAVSGDGEQHGIRDRELFGAPVQVFPHTIVKTVVVFLDTPQEAS